MPSVLAGLPGRLAEVAAIHDAPGAAMAVSHGGERVEAATGVLDVDTREPVTRDSLFPVASVTKPWTATLVLQLVDEGLVHLDEPVRRYLPEFGVVDPGASDVITVRHLLAHTGGFAGDIFTDTGSDDEALARYLVHLRDAATQIHPPGAIFSYCNSGYCVLGALVARLRGGTWESAVRARLADPLGADHIALSPADGARFAVASAHLSPEGSDAYAAVPGWQLPRSNAPAGSVMYAAPRELVRLGRMMCAGGDGVLSTGAVAAMCAPQVPVPGVRGRGPRHWGLGLAIFDWDGTAAVGHEGDLPGCSAAWWVVPAHDLVIAVAVNSATAIGGVVDDLVVPLVEELTGVRVPARAVPPAVGPEVDNGRYVGTFAAPLADYEVTADGAALTIVTTPKGLAAQMGRQRHSARYVPVTDDTYITAEPVDGRHDTVAFLDDGRFLHAGRAAPRVT